MFKCKCRKCLRHMPIKKVRLVWDTWICDDCREGKKVKEYKFVTPKFKYIDLDYVHIKPKPKKVKTKKSKKSKKVKND